MNTRLQRAVEQLDFFRWPAPWRPPGAYFKEWQHFCLYGPDIDLLINFSLVESGPPALAQTRRHGRTIVLAYADRWMGTICRTPDEELEVLTGGLAARWQGSSLQFDGGKYRLRVRLPKDAVFIDLTLEPLVFPAPAYEIDTGDGPPINWVVIPRLRANGFGDIQGRHFRFRDAPAYHDHNWGAFAWGANFSWEWGYGLPRDLENPWTLVFVRLNDRGHHHTLMQGAFLWEGNEPARTFRDGNLQIRRHQLLRPTRVTKIPPVLDLVRPGTASDVPRTLELWGHTEEARFEARFESNEAAQVLIPNDVDPGVTVINEVSASFFASGTVQGRDFSIKGGAVFEYLAS